MDYDPVHDANFITSHRVATIHDEAALHEFNFLQKELYKIWNMLPPCDLSGKWKKRESFLKRRIEQARRKLSDPRENI